MRKAIKAGVAVLALWLAVTNLYVMAMHASAVLEKHEVHWTFKAPLYVGAIVGLAADVGFNASVGTVVFREVPKELLFTSRATRHLESDGWRKDRAEWWCTQLHFFDSGHCGGWVPDGIP